MRGFRSGPRSPVKSLPILMFQSIRKGGSKGPRTQPDLVSGGRGASTHPHHRSPPYDSAWDSTSFGRGRPSPLSLRPSAVDTWDSGVGGALCDEAVGRGGEIDAVESLPDGERLCQFARTAAELLDSRAEPMTHIGWTFRCFACLSN